MKHLLLLKDKIYQLCLRQTQLSEQVEQLQTNLKSEHNNYIALSNEHEDLKQQQDNYQAIYNSVQDKIELLIEHLSNQTKQKNASPVNPTSTATKKVHSHRLSDEKKQTIESFFKEDSIYFASDDESDQE